MKLPYKIGRPAEHEGHLVCVCVCVYTHTWAGIAQLVQRLATGWTVRGSNPDWGVIFRTRPDRPWGLPSLLYNGYRVLPGVERPGRGVDHHPHLASRLKKE